MTYWKHCAVAVAFGLGAIGSAAAADLVEEPYVPLPAVGGWYLRGDIGYTAQRVGSLYNVLYDNVDTVVNLQKDFSPAPFIGFGAGYRWNDFFRTDITGEYRFRSDFDGRDAVFDAGGDFGDDYSGWKDEWTFLANAYVDLGTYSGLTPFLGAGIGASYNTIHGFTDFNPDTSTLATADDHGEWHFAWALYAGVGWAVSPNVTVEVAYRYLDLGSASSGDLKTISDPGDYNPMEFNDLTSHDVKLGVRYSFN